MKNIILGLIKTYQLFSKTIIKSNSLPLVVPVQCRFYPTCSDYTLISIHKHGSIKGLKMGFIRFLKCNPFIKP